MPRLGRQPAADQIVWLFNEVVEEQADGSWLGWIEPLDSSLGERVMEVKKDTPQEVRDHWVIEWCRLGQEQGKDAWQEFLNEYAKPMLAASVPPLNWPPNSGCYRKLAFLD